MKISPRLGIMQKHRQVLTQKIEQLIATQNSWEARRRGPAACYDYRYPEAYYLNLKHRCQTLSRKNKLSAGEREEIINAALAHSYYSHLNLIFSQPDLENYSTRQPAPGEYWERIVQSLKRGAYYQKIQPAPRQAQKYFQQALARTRATRAGGMALRNSLLPQVYDYLAIALEARRLFSQAETCLTRALTLGRENRTEPHMIKHLYIKRALLRRRTGALREALEDLTAAAAWRTDYFRERTVFDLDDVIYWEKAKIYLEMKDYRAAQKMLTQLMNVCELNYRPRAPGAVPRCLLRETLKNHHAALAAKQAAARGKDLPLVLEPDSFPELPSNYDIFQVNTYCPNYQDFIALIYAQDNKSAQDWEYIVAYRLSRLGDKRPYEKLIAPYVRREGGNDKEWLRAALQNFYYRRDYSTTMHILDQHLAQTPDCGGFELAAKVHLARGDYKAALKYLARGQALVKKLCPGGAPEKAYSGQRKMYLLLQGIAAARMHKGAPARRDFAAALKIDAATEDSYRRVDDLIYWELARLELRAGNRAAALGYFKKIYHHEVINEYWAFLLNEH